MRESRSSCFPGKNLFHTEIMFAMDASYSETLRYLFGLEVFGIRPGLESVNQLLARVGDPHRCLRFVHVAGTSGKGSVSAFIHAILQAAGYNAGLYTSPHLLDFTERIQAGDRPIPVEDLVRLTDWMRARAEGLSYTFFEFTTTLALLYFLEQKVDVVVLEAGLGGRLDATNAVVPRVSVITTISLDHTEYLGGRLADIAFEKGGIIKPGIPAVITATQRTVISVLEAVCRERGAPLCLLNRDFRLRGRNRRDFTYLGLSLRLRHLETGLAGRFQMTNAAAALASIELLSREDFPVAEEHIRRGLREAFIPARLQVVRRNPTVVLDGAHNPGKARQLARAVDEEFTYRSLHLVFGIMRDKDARAVLKHLAPPAKRIFLVRPPGARSADPAALQAILEKRGSDAYVAGGVSEGIRMAMEDAHPDDLILVCGSFYTVSEALAHKAWENKSAMAAT
ncbi:MAG: bifunctional folylpolyglutamate synthase/dihydrofolate synthase [Deltaproteobacteria bacterium]|nr:bifunctional folylpolyglutamate synthase/dihydrofolate synthase [Deltaproteobacteria bacterium]